MRAVASHLRCSRAIRWKTCLLKLLSVNAKIGRVAYAGLDEARVLLASTAAMLRWVRVGGSTTRLKERSMARKLPALLVVGLAFAILAVGCAQTAPRQRDLNAEAMREMSWWGDFAR